MRVTFDGPLSASAYELLGVAASADDDELRRAYRLRLRQTHPDTGGDAALFVRVQRAWELIGTPEARARYDRSSGAWAAPSASGRRSGTRPGTKSYGTAGAWHRLRYLQLLTEHLGRAVTAREAVDPVTVRSAPWQARRMLAEALAEEATASTIDDLGIGFTAWHDLVAGSDAAQKLSHAVLGPAGLYGLASEDFGDPVRFRQGEVIGTGVGGETPVADLLARVRTISRAARVRFAGAILILPDEQLDEAVTVLGSVRGVLVAVVRRSSLRTVLRGGIPGARPLGAVEAFDVRTRLPQAARVLVP
ncbi:J domain-containing protein [Microbacterium esteraromaticum]|uniref:J domain-containing protein n=1 Tax=Microbacterium esteraromaticum TaxID=57043 RepID=A0A7D7W6R9_9MICO|nr:J domain-containing protein [Microbacterium esteraromaticum]QMU96716.1 J domain-containing protein [Microbacterium esteraromaticum]